MNPLVSICIPTYNRAAVLDATVRSIVQQSAFKTRNYEVIISDNASDDDTMQIGERYARLYDNVKYYRNEKNVRDQNFLLAIKRATGNLRKLWNDTLIMKPRGANFFLHVEKKYRKEQPVLFFENTHPRFFERKDSGFLQFDKFVQRASYHITAISSFAVWKSDVAHLDKGGTEKSLWQTQQLCKMLQRKGGGVYFKYPFARGKNVEGKDRSYGIHKVFYQNFLKEIVHPYVEHGNITETTWHYVKKRLLYEFFVPTLIQWEKWQKGDSSQLFSQKENLWELICKEYDNEDYFDDFKYYYELMKMKDDGRVKYKYHRLKYKMKGIFHTIQG